MNPFIKNLFAHYCRQLINCQIGLLYIYSITLIFLQYHSPSLLFILVCLSLSVSLCALESLYNELAFILHAALPFYFPHTHSHSLHATVTVSLVFTHTSQDQAASLTYCNSNLTIVCTGSKPMNDEGDILVRKYGETIYNTISSVAAVAIDYPKGKTTTTTATQSVSCFVIFFLQR